MSMKRRTLLKGMALGGLAAPLLASPLTVLANATFAPVAGMKRPTLVLVDSAAETTFVHGARAAAGSALQILFADRSLAFVRELEHRLRDKRPVRMIGLLKNADAAPLLDVIRAAGLGIPWLGQHSANAQHSRHRLLTTSKTAGCASQLGRQLEECGAGFSISEDRPDQPAPALKADVGARSADFPDQWATSVGWLLAATRTQAAGAAPLLPSVRTPLVGSFVSFLVESEGA